MKKAFTIILFSLLLVIALMCLVSIPCKAQTYSYSYMKTDSIEATVDRGMTLQQAFEGITPNRTNDGIYFTLQDSYYIIYLESTRCRFTAKSLAYKTYNISADFLTMIEYTRSGMRYNAMYVNSNAK